MYKLKKQNYKRNQQKQFLEWGQNSEKSPELPDHWAEPGQTTPGESEQLVQNILCSLLSQISRTQSSARALNFASVQELRCMKAQKPTNIFKCIYPPVHLSMQPSIRLSIYLSAHIYKNPHNMFDSCLVSWFWVNSVQFTLNWTETVDQTRMLSDLRTSPR